MKEKIYDWYGKEYGAITAFAKELGVAKTFVYRRLSGEIKLSDYERKKWEKVLKGKRND